MEIGVFWAFLFGALFLGVPIAFAIGAGAFALLLLFVEGMPLKGMIVIMAQRMFAGADSFPLLAIPLFFLAVKIVQEYERGV
ncbi:MAG: TRAP transporter large permease subunit, partial [Phycisphaeraceae bacterium]